MYASKPIRSYKNKKEEDGIRADFLKKQVLLGVVSKMPWGLGLELVEPCNDIFPEKDVRMDVRNPDNHALVLDEIWLVRVTGWHSIIGKTYKGREIVHLDGVLMRPATTDDKEAALLVALINEETEDTILLETEHRHTERYEAHPKKNVLRGELSVETVWEAHKRFPWGMGFITREEFEEILSGSSKTFRLDLKDKDERDAVEGEKWVVSVTGWHHKDGDRDTREREIVYIEGMLKEKFADKVVKTERPYPKKREEAKEPFFGRGEDDEYAPVVKKGRHQGHQVKKSVDRHNEDEHPFKKSTWGENFDKSQLTKLKGALCLEQDE
ncbi:MAG: hypothetical protein WCT49_05105 [Candidatus Paceibacterota bacterium]|jgi:hypothetical protein|nr:hypothetical protein [Candidatus Paceibacterota bacterium]